MRSIHRLLLSLTIIVISMFAFVACGGSSSSNTGTAVTPTSTSAASTAPSTQHFKVGQTVKVGDTWEVTINSAKTSEGEQFLTPPAGHHYLIVDVTLKNISSQEQNVSSALNFTLQDSTGQKYTETILPGKTPPDGKVEANSPLRGQLSYEVPTDQKAFTLAFEANIISGGQTNWDIHV
jgi:hypothetical protein